MAGIEPNWPTLLCLSVLWTICCIVFLLLADLVPLRGRLASRASRFELGVLVANFVLLFSLALSTLIYGLAELKGTSIVIALGLILLFAPALLRFLPAVITRPRSSPVIILVIQVVLLALFMLKGKVGAWHAN
jgi:hypothetical protein